jgi:hypothetical protein
VLAALLAAGCGGPKPASTETVTVTAPQSQAAPDPNGVRSELIPVTLPAGTKPACCGKYDGMEVWNTPTSYAYNVQSLREQLPIGKEYEGMPWCTQQINGKLGLTEWFWETDKDLIHVVVNDDGTITFTRGPDDSGRAGFCDTP